ncbi:hypothetical protein Bca101_081823 [Brassica carinata]
MAKKTHEKRTHLISRLMIQNLKHRDDENSEKKRMLKVQYHCVHYLSCTCVHVCESERETITNTIDVDCTHQRINHCSPS